MRVCDSEVSSIIKFVEIFNYSLKYLPELIYYFKDLNYKFLIFIDDITLDNSQNEFKLFNEKTTLNQIQQYQSCMTNKLLLQTNFNKSKNQPIN